MEIRKPIHGNWGKIRKVVLMSSEKPKNEKKMEFVRREWKGMPARSAIEWMNGEFLGNSFSLFYLVKNSLSIFFVSGSRTSRLQTHAMDAQLPITFILSFFPSTHLGCIRSHSLAGLPVASPRKFADSAVGNLIYFVRLVTLCHGRSKAKVALFPLKSLLRSYCLLLSAVVFYIRY